MLAELCARFVARLIRLPSEYRQNTDGEYDHEVYKTNLAVVEAMIRDHDIFIEPVDEATLGNVDLDKDGDDWHTMPHGYDADQK